MPVSSAGRSAPRVTLDRSAAAVQGYLKWNATDDGKVDPAVRAAARAIRWLRSSRNKGRTPPCGIALKMRLLRLV